MKQKRNPLTGRWDITGKDVKDTGPLQILIVDALPPTGEEGTIYIVEGALYSTMYVRDPEHNVFVKVGTTQLTTQEQADWLQEDETAVDYIKNKPILAEVAYTGDYESLENLPEIPEVFNTTITFRKNGSIVGIISTNQQEPSDIDFTIPTKTSELENDSGFISEIPHIPTKTSELENDSGFINKYVNNLEYYTKTEDLADVALSNDYNDLDNKPTIPTKLSDLTNDTGFIDNTVNNLINYYTKTETYTKQEVLDLLAGISSLRVEVVETLPNPGEFGVIYLIETETPGTYNQYILTELPNTYAMVGSTAVDLTNYFNKVTDNSDDIVQGNTNLFMTQAEKINLSHQSGYNTGDETRNTILAKMGPASATSDGYLKKEDWVEFDSKVDYDDFVWQDVSGGIININNYSTEITTGNNVTVNVGSSVKSGLVYLLKVNATSNMHLNLGNNITNGNDISLDVASGHTKIFTFLATSATELVLQGIDLTDYVKRNQLGTVAFSNDYNDLDNKPASPDIPNVYNGKTYFTYNGEDIGYVTANQQGNKTIDIPAVAPSTNMFTTIGYIQAGETATYTHGLGGAPRIINIDGFSSMSPDSKGRERNIRALGMRQDGYLSYVGSTITFSNGTDPGFAADLASFPLEVTVTSTKIRITAKSGHTHNKYRITAYL